jgi:CheY-like chemotaxis protein
MFAFHFPGPDDKVTNPHRGDEMVTSEKLILVVEDNDNDVLLILRAFKKVGWPGRVEVKRDGAEAIAYLIGEPPYKDRDVFPLPALVILDLKMPRVDGFEVLAVIKTEAELRRIPVIILTSSGETADIARCYDLGANSYLVKPITFDEFTGVVDEIDKYWLSINVSPPVGDRLTSAAD